MLNKCSRLGYLSSLEKVLLKPTISEYVNMKTNLLRDMFLQKKPRLNLVLVLTLFKDSVS